MAKNGLAKIGLAKVGLNRLSRQGQHGTRCLLPLPSRGIPRIQKKVPACNRRRSNSCKSSVSFLPASVVAKRHLVNTRPRTPVADFVPRGRAAADRIMSACQRPRVSDMMMATPTAPSSRSRRGFRLRAAGDPDARTGSWPVQPPGESGAMSASIGVKTIGLEHNGFNQVLLNTSFNTKVPHARAEDEWSWRLRGEEVDFVWRMTAYTAYS